MKTKAFLKYLVRYVANGHSFLDHSNTVPDACVDGLSTAIQQLSNTHYPFIFVATHDSHARSLAKYHFFISLGEAYHDPTRCSFAVENYYSKSG